MSFGIGGNSTKKLTLQQIKDKILKKFGYSIRIVDESEYKNTRTKIRFLVEKLGIYEGFIGDVLKRWRIINCLWCGKVKLDGRGDGKFCTRSCGSKWNSRYDINTIKQRKESFKKKKIYTETTTKYCETCGKLFEIFIHALERKGRGRFCSKSCKSSFIIKNNPQISIAGANSTRNKRFTGGKHTLENKIKIACATNSRQSKGRWSCLWKPFIDVNGRKHNMKSSYEIAFAEQYLDKNKFNWDYEPSLFFIGDEHEIYTPDFYNKDLDSWYELKGYGNSRKFDLFISENNFKGEFLYGKDLISEYNIDLSAKSIRSIMVKWRDYGTRWKQKNKNFNNKRYAVEVTSGIEEESSMKTQNMLETPKALSAKCDNLKDVTMDNQQAQAHARPQRLPMGNSIELVV